MTSSWKRQKTAPADDDTRVVEHRCDSPPAAQEIPGGPLYESESDDDTIASSPAHEDEDDDADFTFSPASPPLTQSTEDQRTMSVPITLYVFPDETVVLKPDGGCDRIADKHTITQPKPSTSTSTIYNLTTGHGDSTLWTALLSSSLGYLLPNHTLRRNGD